MQQNQRACEHAEQRESWAQFVCTAALPGLFHHNLKDRRARLRCFSAEAGMA
jgi:hypothetical protein